MSSTKQKLVTKLTVTLAPSGSSIVPHGLFNAHDVGMKPHHVFPTTNTPIACTSADATNCVFSLSADALESATATFEVIGWHSIEAPSPAVSGNQSLWAGSGAEAGSSINRFQTSGTTTVYINSATGDDENDGLTALTPLASLAGWMAKFAAFTVHPGQMIVGLADSLNQYWNTVLPDPLATPLDYEVDAIMLNSVAAEYLYGALSIRGPQMVHVAETGTEFREISATALTAGTESMTVDVTGGVNWAVNGLKQNWVQFENLAGAVPTDKLYYELPIVSNTATQLTLDVNTIRAALNALIGTVWARIVRPGANIAAVGANFAITIGGIGGAMVGDYDASQHSGGVFERIRFRDYTIVRNEFSGVFDRCRFDGIATYGARVGMINCLAAVDVAWEGGSVDRPVPRPDLATGTTNPNTQTRDTQMQLLSYVGIVVGRESGGAMLLATRNLSSYSGGVDGITVGPGAKLVMSDQVTGSTPALQGSGNTGVGLRVLTNGLARIEIPTTAGPTTTGKCTITGTGGSLKVSTGAAVAYGLAAGNFSEVVGWNNNFTRVLEGTAVHPTGDASIITTRATV